VAFYGDGSKLKEVYGKKGETLDEAASKFFGTDRVVPLQNPEKITLSYQEAKQLAQ
jgi:hypothetical protein